MTLTLVIESSTGLGSVAVLRGNTLLGEESVMTRGQRDERLMPAVESLLHRLEISVPALGRIVCGAGPGSFTSLRISAAIAKGIATATNIELYAVSSLALLVGAAEQKPGVYLAAMDAMRGESFVCAVTVGERGDVCELRPTERIATDQLVTCAEREGAILIGPGLTRDVSPIASGIRRVTPSLVRKVDLDEWEPTYGRLAEAQVKWEASHGRPLNSAG